VGSVDSRYLKFEEKIPDSKALRRAKPAHITGVIKEKSSGKRGGEKSNRRRPCQFVQRSTDIDHRQDNSINYFYRLPAHLTIAERYLLDITRLFSVGQMGYFSS
jgi:hypothetical protein